MNNDDNTFYRVCQLSYKYFLRYENLDAEWKQLLQDSGITEDLQLGRENEVSTGSQGKEVVRTYICLANPEPFTT